MQNERKLQCDDNAYCYCYCTNVVPVFFNSFNCLANTVDVQAACQKDEGGKVCEAQVAAIC